MSAASIKSFTNRVKQDTQSSMAKNNNKVYNKNILWIGIGYAEEAILFILHNLNVFIEKSGPTLDFKIIGIDIR
jgi:hypothetical protein